MKYLVLLLALSMSLNSFANEELDELKAQVRDLQAKVGGNNLKLGVDLRAETNNIEYTMADGTKKTQDWIMANRLWINMGYKYNDNLTFTGKLSYYKTYGQDMAVTSNDVNRNFDWVASSNPNSDKLRVKEAYMIYFSDGLFGYKKLPWIFSIGRRPSDGGFLANYRNGFDAPNSPLAHNINMEFDGFSMTFKLDQIVPVQGFEFKICAGRGTTNATPRFSSTGTDFYRGTAPNESDLIGFIFTPYNDGQYIAKLNMFVGKNLIGYLDADGNGSIDDATATSVPFHDFGNLTGGAFSFQVSGIGDMINDFLDDTTFFASYAWSKTDPNGLGRGMLGSQNKESGASYWFGLQIPVYLVDGDRLGFEYNHGDKYWRSFTYGEDTLAGSKLATRGDAIEVYYNMPLIDKALTAQIRYTKMTYDYTGSNGFFGDYSGTPAEIATLTTNQKGQVVEEAQIIRAYLRYSY